MPPKTPLHEADAAELDFWGPNDLDDNAVDEDGNAVDADGWPILRRSTKETFSARVVL